MHHDGTGTPDKGLTEASTDAPLLHPSPCLLTSPLGAADLTIEGGPFAFEADDRETLSTFFAADASFLHHPLIVLSLFCERGIWQW